jgi:hypothetical protein
MTPSDFKHSLARRKPPDGLALALDDNGVQRLSDAELITQLANQAKELGIEIDLSYRLAVR